MSLLRPLLATKADQDRFIDHEVETDRVLRAAREGRNVVVFGTYGAGKSSLLARARFLDDGDDRRWVTVSAESAESPAAILLSILARLDPNAVGRWHARMTAPSFDLVQPALVRQLLDELDAAAENLVICVDGVVPDVAYALFGSARNDVWAVAGAGWIVAANANERELVLRPPADAFFDVVVDLGPLDEVNARRLLREYAPELTQDQITSAINHGRGVPARLLRAAALLADGGDLAGTNYPAREIEASTPKARLLSWLTTHGATSASDPNMLSDVGVSRQRAHQILNELLEREMVTVSQERPEGRGQPRKLYVLTSTGR